MSCYVVQLDQSASSVTSVGRTDMSMAETEFPTIPTLQFAESVKRFVSKCQALSITGEEYHLMKLIALFQSAGQIRVYSCFYLDFYVFGTFFWVFSVVRCLILA